MNILALNAGSSSLKFRLFQVDDGTETVLTEGTAERVDGAGLASAAGAAIGQCKPFGIDAVGHRIVHGGDKFTAAARVTPEMLETLRSLRGLDPLHNPGEIGLIEESQHLLPDIPNVACFDTAFHRTLPEVAYTYALPKDLSKRLTLRRYGFHGLSHHYVSGRLLECLHKDAAGTKLITCHLGSGASVCALRDGKSLDTSMGLTPLEGLVMGTRSGDIDPGLLLYLLREHGMTAEQLDDVLNKQSGLLGVSGLSSDLRDLEKAAAGSSAAAELALSLFAYRVRKYLGGYAAVLGGIDAVAFTGGIGERSPDMRGRICAGLNFLGLSLNADANKSADGKATARIDAGAGVSVWVIPTDEERQIVREVAEVLK